jgi:branched-chain amino acid transport system permease protein
MHITLGTFLQALASGLLMGLIYALIAAGLSLIFGLMEVVNFAHGEFVMLAMYTSFGLFLASGIDPLLLVPATAAFLFVFGVAVYRVLISRAMQARANIGMAQVFVTFGLAIFLRGVVQLIATPEFRSIKTSWLAGKTISFGGVYLPLPQLASGAVCLAAFAGLSLMMSRTDFGRAIEATREDSEAVGLLGIDRHRIFALGWGVGAAVVGIAGAMLATFYYIYPDVGATFALIAYVTVALGGFGSIIGALFAGVLIGLTESLTALVIEPALKQVGIYAIYMLVVTLRPKGLFGAF